MEDVTVDALRLRFAVPADDEERFSEADKTVLARLYVHQLAYRARIEATAPGSAERANLIGEMYAESWALTAESDFYARYAGNTAQLQDRRKDALALLRLSGAKRVLEVGVGQGALADGMAGQGCSVDGIDVAPGLQWEAIQAQYPGRVHLWTGKLQDVPASTYDLCILDNVLEHIPSGDYEMCLHSCYRALRPGGWLVVCIPNPLTGPHDTSRWFTQPGGPATGDHFNERTINQLKGDFRRAGFRSFRTTVTNTVSSDKASGMVSTVGVACAPV